MSDASRLKLCRNVNVSIAWGRRKRRESRRLSLTTAGSSINAELGGVSAGGTGTPEFDVTQRGDGPWTFVATQPEGNAGGVTLSKSSLIVTGWKQGKGEHEGTGDGVGPTAVEISTRPQPYTLFGGPAVPHWVEAMK